MKTMQIHLVACVLDGGEALGLDYVAAALEQHGHRTRVHTFRDPRGLERAARSVASTDTPLVGVSMPSGHAAIHAVAFVGRLRALGFEGHLTAGGPFATLARERLLREVSGIDSVVRQDGEVPMAMLAASLAGGGGPEDVPGVTTREGDGPTPAGDLHEQFLKLHPRRSSYKTFAGVGAARLSATRGCTNACRYCGLAGLRRDARASGVVADGITRRSAEHVADEIAHLYHEQQIRFLHFVDENHLPADEAEAVGVLEDLAMALDKRGVHRRALSLMLRADIATEAVVEAMARLGVVRSLLGVESMTSSSLDALGRGAGAESNLPAMRRMARRGILFHFNVLLIHPHSTLEDIHRDVAALGQVEGGLLDPFQVELFEGTRMFERMQDEGRVRGGPFVWHYELEDPGAEAFARTFQTVKLRVMGRVPLTTFAYDVLGTHAVARHLGMICGDAARLERTSADLVEEHNRLWLSILDQAVEQSSTEARCQEAFLDEATERAARLTLEFERFRTRLERSCSRHLTSDLSLPRTAAAVALALSVLGAGCSNTNIAGDADVDEVELVADLPDTTAPEADVDDEVCDWHQARIEHDTIRFAGEEDGCEWPCEDIDGMNAFRFVLDADGAVTDIEFEDGTEIPALVKQCYMDAVAGQTFPCLEEIGYWEECYTALA